MKTRIEHDSMGKVRVPSKALYGAQTQRALANFQISGRVAHPSLIRAYLRIKSAAASANYRCGALSLKHKQLIQKAVGDILRLPTEKWSDLFPVDAYQAGAGTSQNMNVNEVIANVANHATGVRLGANSPIHPNDHVNRSQSTNDTYPTAMRLALLEESGPLVQELRNLAQVFQRHAKEWMNIPKAARTHLQDAVPMQLGREIGAYGATLAQTADWLDAARDELRKLGIGGSAAGTGLTVPKGFVAAILPELQRTTGESLTPARDLCESMQSQAPILFYSSALRMIAIQLTRICNDLRLLASGPLTGFAEMVLPPVQPGSSIMPGKVNPSILEMCNQSCFSILGYDHAIAQAVQAGQLELNVMMPMMAFSALEATSIAKGAIRTLREKTVEGLRPNETRLRRYFESTPQIATALSPKLGYEATAALVSESIRSGTTVVELIRSKNLLTNVELESLLNSSAGLFVGRSRKAASRR